MIVHLSVSCCFRILLVVVLYRICGSDNSKDGVLCKDYEREALFEFKKGLIDKADRLASWIGEGNDCCNWTGIVCDHSTGHVHKIHLPGECRTNEYNTVSEYEQALKQKLGGDLSPSLVNLTKLKHLDLSCNDFGEMEIPGFMGALGSLRYLNLSRSRFGGEIPPQVGNMSELRTLCLGSFYEDDNEEYETTSIMDIRWLSGLRLLRHLDLSRVDLSEATDWIQVINTLPSLVELHLSKSQLLHMHPYVANQNLTSLSLLDISGNSFDNNYVLQWIFSISSLVTLDLRGCGFKGPIPGIIDGSFRNLTSLESLHVHENDFMSSSLVLKGLSSVGSNLIFLDISSCGVSSSTLDSLHNLTSLVSLDLSFNKLNKTITASLGNLCKLRHIALGGNSFPDIRLTSLLQSFFKCKSPRLRSLSLESSGLSSPLPSQLGKLVYLEYLQLGNNHITGIIPDSIGRLSFLRSLYLSKNLISGSIPNSVGGLSSLEVLDLSYNQINGSLPDSLGQLLKLSYLDFSYNFLTGVVTDSHFDKLAGLKYLNGISNHLSLRPHLATWVPSFQLQFLYLSSWDLGPVIPLWLQLQKDLIDLDISNTRISTSITKPFWSSLPNLGYLNMSHNQIQGRLFGITASIQVLDLSSNKLSGEMPPLPNGSLARIFVLSNNSFRGSLHHLLCPYDEKSLEVLDVANNNLSGIIPDCWKKWPSLTFLNMENNKLSGGIPRTLGSLAFLASLNVCNNNLSGNLTTSLKSLKNLVILQLARNKLVGEIPAWFGTDLLSLVFLNLRSNNLTGNITNELCYITGIQILDLAHNKLSGNVPRCFNNFTILSGKEITSTDRFIFSQPRNIIGSASLVIKGREDTYSTILGLVKILDLSSNNFFGSIPSELMSLPALQSLNLSRNQLTGGIPEKIGDLKSLSSFDVSLNRLSGELPASLSSLSFLSSFNVSFNNLTGRVPSGTQFQTFNESSFFGNKLCGDPLTERCASELPDKKQEEEDDDDESHETNWDLIISTMSGFITGFWLVAVPLIVNKTWRTAYFHVLSNLRLMFCGLTRTRPALTRTRFDPLPKPVRPARFARPMYHK